MAFLISRNIESSNFHVQFSVQWHLGLREVLEIRFLEGKVLHKGAWFVALLGTLFGSRAIKRSNFYVQYS